MGKTLKWRREKDNKIHLDVDGSKRFGLTFSNYKAMRKAVSSAYGLKKVKKVK